MIIRKECIGQGYSKKSPFNDCHFKGVITEDPENFALYKVLELDVFEKDIPPAAEVVSDELIVESEEETKPKNKNRDK